MNRLGYVILKILKKKNCTNHFHSMTLQEIMEMSKSCRTTTSRKIKKLREQGYVERGCGDWQAYTYYMANTCNFFMGACADGLNKSLQDYIDDSRKANRREVELPSIINTGLEFQTLPKTEQIDDMYADFLVKHANELDPYLILIKPSEIRGDEEYVCKVLRMIVNQSIKLDKEIEIPSRKYVVEL